MKLEWEECRGVDHELIWGSVGLAILVASTLLPVDRLLAASGYHCTFHALTGLPCPSCRATRALVAAGSLYLREAFGLNPLGAVLFIGLGFCVPLALTSAALQTRRPRIRTVSRTGKKRLLLAGSALVAANWAYLIATAAAYP